MNSTPDDMDVLEVLMDVTADIFLLFIVVALHKTTKTMNVIAWGTKISPHAR
jgi:hypothetical protein